MISASASSLLHRQLGSLASRRRVYIENGAHATTQTGEFDTPIRRDSHTTRPAERHSSGKEDAGCGRSGWQGLSRRETRCSVDDAFRLLWSLGVGDALRFYWFPRMRRSVERARRGFRPVISEAIYHLESFVNQSKKTTAAYTDCALDLSHPIPSPGSKI